MSWILWMLHGGDSGFCDIPEDCWCFCFTWQLTVSCATFCGLYLKSLCSSFSLCCATLSLSCVHIIQGGVSGDMCGVSSLTELRDPLLCLSFLWNSPLIPVAAMVAQNPFSFPPARKIARVSIGFLVAVAQS